MTDERVIQEVQLDKEAMRADLAKRDRGEELDNVPAYNYDSRKPPEGYTTIRDAFRYADIHPSWLRTLLSDGKFAQYDEDGLPAVTKNARGTWAVRIDAVQKYASGMRSTEPGDGESTSAGYRYEPQELKAAKRTLSSAKERGLPEAVVQELESLVGELDEMWERGEIGKAPKAEVRAEEAAEDADDEEAEETADNDTEPEDAGNDDADFSFDFGDEE